MNPYEKVASGMVAKAARIPNFDSPYKFGPGLHRSYKPRPRMKYPTFPARPAPRPNGKLWT